MASTWTQADRDSLAAAIAKGVKRYRANTGEEVEFQTIGDMRSLLAEMDRALGTAPTHRFASISKGF